MNSANILLRLSPRMLLVYEVHHLLAGSRRELRAALNLLKYLGNELKICIVAVGTSDAPLAFQSVHRLAAELRPSRTRCGRKVKTFGGCSVPLNRPCLCGGKLT